MNNWNKQAANILSNWKFVYNKINLLLEKKINLFYLNQKNPTQTLEPIAPQLKPTVKL